MFTSVALLALALNPAQGQPALNLANARVTYGELGSTRPDNKYLPGDVFFCSFDINGLKANDTGRVRYRMAMEINDSAGKSIYNNPPVERDDFLPLGGTRLPARAYVNILHDQAAGTYTCRVTVTDLSITDAKVTKTIEQKFEVLPKGFGIVQLYTAVDLEGKISAPLVGVAGQVIYVHFAVIGFERDPKTKQPNLTIEMVVFDGDKQPTLKAPVAKQVPDDADGRVPEMNVGVPMRFALPLNREGGFLIQLKATDNLNKKSTIVYLPLRVFPAGN